MNEENVKVDCQSPMTEEQENTLSGLEEMVRKKLIKCYDQREEIIEAFIAKHGCEPDEIEQVFEQNTGCSRWYLQKKTIRSKK